MVRIEVFQDGDMWCALVGKNLQEGIAGFGKTQAEAVIKLGKALKKTPLVTLASRKVMEIPPTILDTSLNEKVRVI